MSQPDPTSLGVTGDARTRLDTISPIDLRDLPTSQRILWIAGALFAERGYGATSMRDIAAATGVAVSALYAHYPSKESILAAFLHRAYDTASTRISSVVFDHAGDPPSQQLRTLVHFGVSAYGWSTALAIVATTELTRVPARLTVAARVRRDEIRETYVDIIERGKARGEFGAPESNRLIMLATRGMGLQVATWLGHWVTDPVEVIAEWFGTFGVRLASSAVVAPPGPTGDLTEPRSGSEAVERIHDAARRLIAAGGYGATTMRAIGAGAGVRAPSLYAHFPSKQHLLALVVERAFRWRRRAVESAVAAATADGLGPAGELAAYVRAATAVSLRDVAGGVVADSEFWHVTDVDPSAIDADRAALADIAESILDRGAAAGEFDFGGHRTIAAAAIAGMIAQLSFNAHEGLEFDERAAVDAYANFAVRMVGYRG